MSGEVDPVRLRDLLLESFNEDEFRDLCFVLRLDYDDLSGTNRSSRARELVNLCERDGRLDELLTEAERLRPRTDWQSVRQTVRPSVTTAGKGTLAALLALQALVDESKAALQVQRRLRSQLLGLLRANRPELALGSGGQDDLFHQLHPTMSSAERDRFEDVRASTVVIHDINRRILDWLRANPNSSLFGQATSATDRLGGQLDALRNHLNFWLTRYDRVFDRDETRALVFMADEKRRGPQWPHGLTGALRAVIAELKAQEE